VACLLDAAGDKMLAGSDSGGAAWEVPGIALHQEFDELAQAGLPPLRILQMTTWDAAEFLGAAGVMGAVEAGQHADLVLLDANPVESAGHLHHIAGVVRGGRYYGPADLDAIKDRIAASQSVS
jgi:imidazolonepropionase-like amidohydrolase